jgi:outer membrane protein
MQQTHAAPSPEPPATGIQSRDAQKAQAVAELLRTKSFTTTFRLHRKYEVRTTIVTRQVWRYRCSVWLDGKEIRRGRLGPVAVDRSRQIRKAPAITEELRVALATEAVELHFARCALVVEYTLRRLRFSRPRPGRYRPRTISLSAVLLVSLLSGSWLWRNPSRVRLEMWPVQSPAAVVRWPQAAVAYHLPAGEAFTVSLPALERTPAGVPVAVTVDPPGDRPQWLTFDREHLQLRGTAPIAAAGQTYELTLRATAEKGGESLLQVALTVTGGTTPPPSPPQDPPEPTAPTLPTDPNCSLKTSKGEPCQRQGGPTEAVKAPIMAAKPAAGRDAARPNRRQLRDRELDPDQLRRLPAGDEAGRKPHTPRAPNRLNGAGPTEAVKAPIMAAKPAAGRDAVIPDRRQLDDRERAGGQLGELDLDQLKRTVAQLRVGEDNGASKRVAQRQGGTIELTLLESIDIALKNNLNIQIAELTKDAAQIEIPRAKALFDPTMGLGLLHSAGRSFPEQAPVNEINAQSARPFIKALVPTGATLLLSTELTREETRPAKPPTEFGSGAGLTVIQPLFRGGRMFVVTKPVRDAEFDLRVEEAKLRAEILRVTAATKSAYYSVIFAEKVIGLINAAIQKNKALIEASQGLFESGLVTKRDVFSAEISRSKNIAKLVSAQADLESAKDAFVDVLGLPIDREVLLRDKGIGFQPIPLELDKWTAIALSNRPEILEIDEKLKKSLLNIRAAKNTVLPQVDLVASYGRSQLGSTFGRSLDLRGQDWSAGIVFSVPIGNVGAKSALARAEIEHARFQEELLQQKRQVELQVRAAVIKLQKSLERMEAFRVIVEQAKGKLEVANGRFALGLATNLDITDAQADILDAETNLLRAIVDYNIGLAELEASAAGPL